MKEQRTFTAQEVCNGILHDTEVSARQRNMLTKCLTMLNVSKTSFRTTTSSLTQHRNPRPSLSGRLVQMAWGGGKGI